MNDFEIAEDGTIIRKSFTNPTPEPPQKTNSGWGWFVAVLLISGIGVGVYFSLESSSVPQQQSYQNTATVKTNDGDGLYVRACPGVACRSLTVAGYGHTLTILQDNYQYDNVNGSSGYWVKVRYNGIEGYVWGIYLAR